MASKPLIDRGELRKALEREIADVVLDTLHVTPRDIARHLLRQDGTISELLFQLDLATATLDSEMEIQAEVRRDLTNAEAARDALRSRLETIALVVEAKGIVSEFRNDLAQKSR